MSLPLLVLLAVGLAMDATAVAGARGLAAPAVRPSDALRVALLFGGFQAAMPLIGYLGGARFASRIAAWDHWLIFVILGGLGAKMIHEAVSGEDDVERAPNGGGVFDLRVLVALAIATSIDALAAGVTLALSGANILTACALIGVVTAALSFAGVYAGRKFGARLGKRLDVFGGVVLIALGVKTLVEHLRGG